MTAKSETALVVGYLVVLQLRVQLSLLPTSEQVLVPVTEALVDVDFLRRVPWGS